MAAPTPGAEDPSAGAVPSAHSSRQASPAMRALHLAPLRANYESEPDGLYPPTSGAASQPMTRRGSSSTAHSTASSHGMNPQLYSAPAKPNMARDQAHGTTSWARVASEADATGPPPEPSGRAAGLGTRSAVSSRLGIRGMHPPSTSASRSPSASTSVLPLGGSEEVSPPYSSPRMSPTSSQTRHRTSQGASAEASGSSSPMNSGTGNSTPSTTRRHKVTETTHLQLQTHPTGRRMINQYIIEDELGRGVHGRVRLAFDTETQERVAVKIVEREGKKRLGAGSASANRLSGAAAAARARGRDDAEGVPEGDEPAAAAVAAAAVRAELAHANERRDSGPRAHFAPTTVPPRAAGPAQTGTSASGRYGRWGEGAPLRPTAADKDMEKQRQKDRERARKQLLWTTDKKVRREIAIMKKCAHDNVVRLKEVIDDPHSKKIFMVLEYMAGGEVVWKDERGFPTLTIDEARRTIRDVVLGLEYLHYQGIIHRDIKPANLLWDENRRVKISDFGVSHFSYALLVASGGLPSGDGDEERAKDPSLLDDHELAKTAGSPAFFAPELCLAGDAALTSLSERLSKRASRTPVSERKEFPWDAASRGSATPGSATPPIGTRRSASTRPPITKAIDVWALGVTLYCLLFGYPPFTADNEFALFAVIPNEDYELPAFAGADRICIGPRRKRWRSLPLWTDEEADVHQDEEPTEPDVDPATLGEDARLLRDLLDRLLEKDPAKRIKLEEVKQHPWVLRDLEDPPAWLEDTDPAHLPFVEVTHEEVEDALTGFTKIKQRFRRLQIKVLEALANGGKRPRSRSISHLPTQEQAQDGSPPSSSALPSPTKEKRQPRFGSGSGPMAQLFLRRPPLKTMATSDARGHGTLKPLTKLGATRGLRSRKLDGTQSQPTSRPPSPGGKTSQADAVPYVPTTDAMTLLRQISQSGHEGVVSGSVSRVPDSHALTMSAASSSGSQTQQRPPLFMRRSSRFADSSRRSIVGPKRSSSDTQRSELTSQEVASSSTGFVPSDHPSRPTTASSEADRAWPARSSRSPSLSQRHPSRSRLGDLFRSVWHSPSLESTSGMTSSRRSVVSSRPGSASRWGGRNFSSSPSQAPTQPSSPHLLSPSASAMSHELRLDAAGAAASQGPREAPSVPVSAPVSRQPTSAFARDMLATPLPNRARSRPPSPGSTTSPQMRGAHAAAAAQPARLELDDVDLDFELSDDDLDEPGGNGRVHSYMRNDGTGWVLHGGDSSGEPSLSPGVSTPESQAPPAHPDEDAGQAASASKRASTQSSGRGPPPGVEALAPDSSLTPLTLQQLAAASAHLDPPQAFELGSDHLRYAAALRRGSASDHSAGGGATLLSSTTAAAAAAAAANSAPVTPMEVGDISTLSARTEGCFADADESAAFVPSPSVAATVQRGEGGAVEVAPHVVQGHGVGGCDGYAMMGERGRGEKRIGDDHGDDGTGRDGEDDEEEEIEDDEDDEDDGCFSFEAGRHALRARTDEEQQQQRPRATPS